MHSSSFISDRVLIDAAVSFQGDLRARSDEDFATAIIRCSVPGETPAVAGMIVQENVYCLTAGRTENAEITPHSIDIEFKLIANISVILQGPVEVFRETTDPSCRILSARLLPRLLSVLKTSSHERLELLERFLREPDRRSDQVEAGRKSGSRTHPAAGQQRALQFSR